MLQGKGGGQKIIYKKSALSFHSVDPGGLTPA